MANPMLMRALDEVRRFLMPSRGIIMWSGTAADIPTGWALCDGTGGTPDLTDRFILGRGKPTSPAQPEARQRLPPASPPEAPERGSASVPPRPAGLPGTPGPESAYGTLPSISGLGAQGPGSASMGRRWMEIHFRLMRII